MTLTVWLALTPIAIRAAQGVRLIQTSETQGS